MNNKILHIDTSQICNLNCIYCCEGFRQNGYLYSDTKYGNIINEIEYNSKIFLSLLKNMKKGYSGVVFSKGEPTLNKGLKRFIKFANKIGYKDIEVVTNGIRVSNISYLKELQLAGLNKITISYNSVFPEINKIISGGRGKDLTQINVGILNAKKLGLCLNINIVLNKYSLIGLDKTLLFLRKIKPNNLVLSFIRYFDFSNPHRNFNMNKIFMNKISYTDFLNMYSEKKDIFSDVNFNDFPICILDKIGKADRNFSVKDYNFFDFQQSKEVNLHGLGQQRSYLDKCYNCQYMSVCSGIENEYVEIFKDIVVSEINPI